MLSSVGHTLIVPPSSGIIWFDKSTVITQLELGHTGMPLELALLDVDELELDVEELELEELEELELLELELEPPVVELELVAELEPVELLELLAAVLLLDAVLEAVPDVALPDAPPAPPRTR